MSVMRDAIRSILLQDWDPHNAASNEAAHHTYDAYIPALADLIQSRVSEEQVMDFLYEREKETMCFPSLGKERLRRAARKLLRLCAV
jgi:TPP-dependent pyruvate/acetoin dehydrogenase alpha subunit